MKMRYRLIIGILFMVSMDLAAQGLVEMNVLEYPFMTDIAYFIGQTDHDIIFPQYDKPRYETEYRFDIDWGNFSMMGSKSFCANGSYSICVSLETGEAPYFFEVYGIRFHTYYNLVPYFDSCNRKKINKRGFINEKAWFYYYWFFEVKDGKVIDAVYFYEPVDDGFEECDVYDLIHNEYIPYKEWKSRIHPEK